jgi:putative flippase GtrA
MLAAQIARYVVAGGLGTAAHLGVLVLCVERLGAGVVAGSVAGFCAALAVCYLFNRAWTFRDGRRQAGRFWRYALVCLSGLVINTGLMLALVDGLHWPYLPAQLSVIFIVPISNFLLSRNWAFDAGGPSRALQPPHDAQ